MERLPDCHQVRDQSCSNQPSEKISQQSIRRFIHLLWVNFKAKWRNQTVGELFLKTAERLPDKVSKAFEKGGMAKVVKAKMEGYDGRP